MISQLYSQGQFKKAVEVYESLLQTLDKKDVLYDEIQVNLLAAKAGLLFSTYQSKEIDPVKERSEDLYEVAYNAASVYLAQGNIAKAQEQLELAQSNINRMKAFAPFFKRNTIYRAMHG